MAKNYKINQEEFRSNLDELFFNVENFRKTENFQKMIAFVSSFKDYSPYNAFLLYQQRPGVRFVLNASAWLKQYSRKIKPNARPLIVLVPFGPVDYVYDISDTYPIDKNGQPTLFAATDEDIIQSAAQPYKTKGYNPIKELDNLCRTLTFNGIEIESFKTGSDFAGQIEILESDRHCKLHFNYKKTQFEWDANYLLSYREGASDGEAFATIIHELGHLFCHHLSAVPLNAWIVRRLDHTTEEFEAEIVSFIVCSHLGIETPSANYLSGYYQRNKTIPNISIETVFTACNHILRMVNGKMKLQDGILYKFDDKFKAFVKSVK